MDNVLSVQNAAKRFGATQALNGAECTLGREELLLLLGPNGAGKTTMVRAIAGRVRLDSGEIRLSTSRKHLGIVPQELALYPLLTARENLEIFGKLHGLSGAELAKQVNWSLEWTGLMERSGSLVKTFSGGMKRRLNIACGVLHRPEIVLLDEPTVGVDPQSRERIWQMLDALRKDGASLLLTTHQLDEAQSRGDRIVIIDHGKTIANGTFAELLEQTVGVERTVTLTLDRLPEQVPADVETNGRTVSASMKDVAAGLPPLLESLHARGIRIDDVDVQAPSLQAVFLHLTGRELRE